MSNADWYARKLRNPQSPRPTESRPPVAPPSHSVPRVQDRPYSQQPRPQDVKVTVDNVAEAAAQWQGGEAMRNERTDCPNCGSHLFFSRKNAGNGLASRCFSCGYSPALPMQTGSM